MEMAIGTPTPMRAMKEPINNSMSVPDILESFRSLEHREAATLVLDEDLDGAQEHHHEACHDRIEDEIARQVDGYQPRVRDHRGVAPHQPAGIGEEGDLAQVDDGGEHSCDPLGQVFVDDVDLDMAGDAYAQDRPQENHHDKAVDGDFFRPCIGVVENVAREELHEHAGGHQPEHD